MNWEHKFSKLNVNLRVIPGLPKELGLAGKVFDLVEDDIGTEFSGEEIANKLTPINEEQAGQSIAAAYKRVTGKKPSKKILKLLLGQWALETGNGKFVHNYNYGNIKASSGSPYVQHFRCSEIIDGKEVFFDPPHPQTAFAAYKTAEDGAVAFINTLKRREHWWKGLHTGTPEGFIKGLTTKPAYFTANPDTYKSVLIDRSNKYTAVANKYGGSGVLTQLAIGSALGLGAVTGVVGYYGIKPLRK
jgi:hypothetical protein